MIKRLIVLFVSVFFTITVVASISDSLHIEGEVPAYMTATLQIKTETSESQFKIDDLNLMSNMDNVNVLVFSDVNDYKDENLLTVSIENI
jgi:hypothetical protein